MTGAVVPHAGVPSHDRSASKRLAEYRAGLESWAFYEGLGPIVFCEGSAFSEAAFRAAVSGTRVPPFEYLSYPASPEASRGKGRAELELIARSLAESRELADTETFLKVTGRYVVRNNERLMQRILAQPLIPDIQVNLHDGLAYADSRVFLCSREFFREKIYSRRAEIDDADETWIEHTLARATLEHAAAGGEWDLLPLPLWIRGVAGTTGKPYDDTLVHYARARAVHSLKRKALGTRATRR